MLTWDVDMGWRHGMLIWGGDMGCSRRCAPLTATLYEKGGFGGRYPMGRARGSAEVYTIGNGALIVYGRRAPPGASRENFWKGVAGRPAAEKLYVWSTFGKKRCRLKSFWKSFGNENPVCSMTSDVLEKLEPNFFQTMADV